jgi:hypothetical protein
LSKLRRARSYHFAIALWRAKEAQSAVKEIQLEIAHVLFIDMVGYSKLSINDQHTAVEELNQIVRASEQFQRAEAASRLLKIPTGDGMGRLGRRLPAKSRG